MVYQIDPLQDLECQLLGPGTWHFQVPAMKIGYPAIANLRIIVSMIHVSQELSPVIY